MHHRRDTHASEAVPPSGWGREKNAPIAVCTRTLLVLLLHRLKRRRRATHKKVERPQATCQSRCHAKSALSSPPPASQDAQSAGSRPREKGLAYTISPLISNSWQWRCSALAAVLYPPDHSKGERWRRASAETEMNRLRRVLHALLPQQPPSSRVAGSACRVH